MRARQGLPQGLAENARRGRVEGPGRARYYL